MWNLGDHDEFPKKVVNTQNNKQQMSVNINRLALQKCGLIPKGGDFVEKTFQVRSNCISIPENNNIFNFGTNLQYSNINVPEVISRTYDWNVGVDMYGGEIRGG